MAFDPVGLSAIVVFYVLILLVGIWAGRKAKPGDDSEDVMLAGRNVGMVVGIFTMTATWVGGGYINGTAELIYTDGLIWCQAPFGYAMSLILGGILFAEKMRNEGYVTMLDPFQIKFGERMGGMLFLPALLGEVFWSAAILAALGATLSVILQIRDDVSVVVSACIAIFYTFFGGLYSVAYTDVVQLFCIFIGLWLCIPAAVMNEHVAPIGGNFDVWIGSIGSLKNFSLWLDSLLLLTFGGIPWQVYFQRVLSSKTAFKAKILSYVAAVGCFVMAIPSVIIGAVAKNTDWNQTNWDLYVNGSRVTTIPPSLTKLTLPLVLRYLTPSYVAFIGLGAVSAAVMSSADSSVLSAASMFARNIWKLAIRPNASEREVLWVMKVGIVLVGVLATVMALTIKTIYGLWYLSSDLVYVILFPQLLCVVYMPKSNTYGSIAGYSVGLLARAVGGEKLLDFPALVHYWGYENGQQYFPFKTLAMLLSLTSITVASYGSHYLFENGYLSPEQDIFMCVVNIPLERRLLKDASLATSTDTLAMTAMGPRCQQPAPPGTAALDPLLLSAHYNGGTTGFSSPTSPSGGNAEERTPLTRANPSSASYDATQQRSF